MNKTKTHGKHRKNEHYYKVNKINSTNIWKQSTDCTRHNEAEDVFIKLTNYQRMLSICWIESIANIEIIYRTNKEEEIYNVSNQIPDGLSKTTTVNFYSGKVK